MNQQQFKSNHPSVHGRKCARRYFDYFCFSLLALSAFAVTKNVRAEDPEKKEQITLQGTVVDEQDQPAQGVKVFVEWQHPKQDRAETKTDQEGRFTLRVPAQSVRHQAILAVGDSPQQMAQYTLPWVIKDEDLPLDKLRLQLQPAQRVELHAVDGAGKPIANAKTGIMGDYRVWGTDTTDKKGQVVYHVPHDVKVQYVFAISDGHGADYKAFTLSREQVGDQLVKPPVVPESPIRLTLDGTQPLKVKVEEADGTPLTGFHVVPWYLKKEGEPRDLNLSYFYSLVQSQTDKSGTASFDWIPHWQKTALTIWPHNQEYEHQRSTYDPQKGQGTLTMKLEKLVPVSGKVTLPDGSPAKGIPVAADGAGYQFDSFHKTVQTDDQGRYSFNAEPNQVYLVIAGNEKWSAAPHTGFAVWPGKPIQNLDFKLQPATRIHGRMTVGSQNEPVADQRIMAFIRGQDAHNQKDFKLPNPTHSNRWVQPQMVFRAQTDKQGHYELFLGPGTYSIRGPSQTQPQKFEITNETEKEINFHASRPETGELTGSVVAGDPPKPVPAAKISGIYRKSLSVGDLAATAGKHGQFKVERQRHPVVLYAESKDKKMAGVVEIGPDAKTVTIPVQPFGSARGQLIDEVTESPVENRELRYGVKVHIGDDNAPWRTSFGGTAFTDKTGHFEMKNLVVGLEYGLSLVNRPEEGKPGRLSWRNVKKFTPENSQPVDLGQVEAPRPSKPYVPPTIDERIAAAFAVKGTPLERFAKAQQIARLTVQYPTILFGDPKSDAVRELMTFRFQDSDVRKELPSFLIMAIDSTEDNRAAAQALAKQLGLDWNPKEGALDLFVLDTTGKQRAHADLAALSKSGSVNKQSLTKFLKANQIPPKDARELLDAALKQAKEQHKRVIVQETATWCGPCRLLSQFLDREREQWQRDYIWIKMDHRWTGADEIMKTMRGGAQGGIPWWAILDQDGKVMATSNNDEGDNIGFPSTRSDLAHVRNMLEKTAIRLNPMEINTLVEALKQKE
ncbi:hypothetical protein [Gimesia algae]|uniref:Nickel uptake substrate-specific transmembrane region n=1 Tax=Gimesia algae TaxID=2527971 RepID=A0A517V664_9PLAN|nr:hypothetical protein [Gimesia algae]QDT88485.1 Nickel uptake substrate-specific transmembrane region [Gimesia algae]